MNSKEIIISQFPELSSTQLDQLSRMGSFYEAWNQKINLISRKDVEHLYLKHILHSMLVSKWITFKSGSQILDAGTGGGFPGIPLAILFPQVEFHLVDSVRKKIGAVDALSAELGLVNVRSTHQRVESLQDTYDFVMARAVAKIEIIRKWTRRLIKPDQSNAIPNGWLLLKGGNLTQELNELPRGSYYEKIELARYCEDPYFDEKYLIYLQA